MHAKTKMTIAPHMCITMGIDTVLIHQQMRGLSEKVVDMDADNLVVSVRGAYLI